MNKTTLTLALALALSGCATLVPPLPEAKPQIAQHWNWPIAAHGDQASGQGWRDVIRDARLQRVLQQTLDNNRDLRVAVLNVERARAQYRIQRAERLPALGGTASMTRSGGDAPVSESYTASLGVTSFELDLFGRVRNLSEAALETYLAQEETRRSTQIALIAETANAWLTLAADESLLQLARETLATYEETLRLTEQRHALGAVSGLELAQARTQVESARGDVARYAGQVAQDKNALELLAGSPVAAEDLPKGFEDGLVVMPALPANAPSELLLARPDIRAAEHSLLAANANIGAARAAFFPSISLTGSAGSSSSALSGLFDSGTRFWRFVPQINIPIFQGGALRAQLGVANANRDIALANYEKAIQSGFREVADALALSGTLNERRSAADALLESARVAERLSKARYDAGRDSYLTLLDAQRTRYNAEQAQVSVRLAEQSNRISLYSALGGEFARSGADTSTP